MKELFKKQLENDVVVTEEILDNSSDAPMERSQEPQPISLELITLNEGQFGLYTYDERLQDKSGLESGKGLPIIRLKQ